MSILGGELEGARVLDPFAGSGALGLEMLSRGAAHADFVELSPASLAASPASAALRSVMSRRWAVKSALPLTEVGVMASSARKREPSARSASTSTRRPSIGPSPVAR